MGQYNKERVDVRILLAGEGLKTSWQGKRATFDGPSSTVVDEPLLRPAAQRLGKTDGGLGRSLAPEPPRTPDQRLGG
jgi:hypothetical protein